MADNLKFPLSNYVVRILRLVLLCERPHIWRYLRVLNFRRMSLTALEMTNPFHITKEERIRLQVFMDLANSFDEIAWIAEPNGELDYYNRYWMISPTTKRLTPFWRGFLGSTTLTWHVSAPAVSVSPARPIQACTNRLASPSHCSDRDRQRGHKDRRACAGTGSS